MSDQVVDFTPLRDIARAVHVLACEKGWYAVPETEHQFIARSVANLHGEVSELWEAERKRQLHEECDKAAKMKELGVTPLTCLEEELADIIIRAMAVAVRLGVDIAGAVESKHVYNASREYRHGMATSQPEFEFGRVQKIGADRLAYAVARLVQLGYLDSRSQASDALLDYLRIGSGGPSDVPTWMEQHEKENPRG